MIKLVRIHLFYNKCLIFHMRPFYGTVVEIHTYDLAKHLLRTVPYDRVEVHCHTRVERVELQRIAHGLYVFTVDTYLAVGLHDAVYRVGIGIPGEQAQCIAMDKHAVAL